MAVWTFTKVGTLQKIPTGTSFTGIYKTKIASRIKVTNTSIPFKCVVGHYGSFFGVVLFYTDTRYT